MFFAHNTKQFESSKVTHQVQQERIEEFWIFDPKKVYT
jgi:hypothetical protein